MYCQERKYFITLPLSKCMGIAPIPTELARQNLPLAGRIRHFLPNLVKLTQDPWELDTVQGFRVPFTQQPFQKQPPKPLQAEACRRRSRSTQLRQRLAGGDPEHDSHRKDHTESAWFPVHGLPGIKDGGQRPVMNPKSLNRFVNTEHLKLEGIYVLRDLLRAGDWITKVDLMDVYFLVPIHREDTVFFKFTFRE